MTPLEDQLSTELRAESELIEPGSIPALELPGPAPHSLRALRRGARRRWPAWVTALAAASAVLAVIAGALTVAHAISAAGPEAPVSPGGPVLYSGIPPYYAYAVQGNIYSSPKFSSGVIARYVKVRATASGKLLTTVRPPAPYDAFESFTGSASDRTFVFAAQWYHDPKLGTPRIYKLDQKTPLKFMILRITPGGRAQLSALHLPVILTEGQAPTLALSPDGARLAVAYGGSGKPAVVQVITLATGRMHQWVSPRPAGTPVLTGLGAWTADGRVLALGQEFIQPNGIIRSTPRQMRLLDTAAPGTDLGAASKMVTLQGAGIFLEPFLTPDGSTLIGETAVRPARLNQTTASGSLSVYSARTGALLRVEARWKRNLNGRNRLFNSGFSQTVVWSNFAGRRLIVKMPHGKLNEVGFLTGDTFTPLPHAAQAPLLTAVNSGGFQTSGGYVGFAW